MQFCQFSSAEYVERKTLAAWSSYQLVAVSISNLEAHLPRRHIHQHRSPAAIRRHYYDDYTGSFEKADLLDPRNQQLPRLPLVCKPAGAGPTNRLFHPSLCRSRRAAWVFPPDSNLFSSSLLELTLPATCHPTTGLLHSPADASNCARSITCHLLPYGQHAKMTKRTQLARQLSGGLRTRQRGRSAPCKKKSAKRTRSTIVCNNSYFRAAPCSPKRTRPPPLFATNRTSENPPPAPTQASYTHPKYLISYRRVLFLEGDSALYVRKLLTPELPEELCRSGSRSRSGDYARVRPG